MGQLRRDKIRGFISIQIFLSRYSKGGRLSELLTKLLVAIEREDRQRLVTSQLALAELLVKPIALQRQDLVHVYDSWTISNSYLEVVPVVRDVLKDAAALRANDRSLKLPDAIHLTTALGTQCRYFLTRDRRIKGQYGVEILDATPENVEALLPKAKQ